MPSVGATGPIIIEPRSDAKKLEPLGHFWHGIWLLRFIAITLYHQKAESYETKMPVMKMKFFFVNFSIKENEASLNTCQIFNLF